MSLFKKKKIEPEEAELTETSSNEENYSDPLSDTVLPVQEEQAVVAPVLPTVFDSINAVLPEPYFIDDDGCLCSVNEKGKSFRITESPIWPVSFMRTHQSEGWSLQVSHKDADDKLHTLTFPMSDIVTGKGSIVGKLADTGLSIVPGRAGNLLSFIQHCKPDVRMILTSQGGWLGNDRKIFVTPHAIIGDTGQEKVVFQQEQNSPTFESMRSSGTLDAWKSGIAEISKQFPLAMFVLMAAFVGPLLKILRLDSGGFHCFGPSSRGKSTLLQIAASVWGKGSDPGRDAKSFVQRWLQTMNSLEAIAACHSDTLICLDELGTFSGDLGHTIYMLAGGSGKVALDSHRRLKSTREWSANLLSSGEKTIRDAIEEGGKNVRAGQLIRVIDLPSGDAFPSNNGQNMGEIVNTLKERSVTSSGTAGPEMVRNLITSLRDNPDQILDNLRAEFEVTVKALTPEAATPEQGRSIRRFAAVEVAGKTAAKFGILPYTDEEIRACVLNVRDRYLRYSPSVPDSQRGVLQLQSFLTRNHTSFSSISDSKAKVSNAKGFSGKGLFLLNDEQLAAAAGVAMSGVIELAKSLKDDGYLVTHEVGRLKTKHRVASADNKHLRFYSIKASLLEADLTGEDASSVRIESAQRQVVVVTQSAISENPQDDEVAEEVVLPQVKRYGLFKKVISPEKIALEMSEEPEPPPEPETLATSIEFKNHGQAAESPETVTSDSRRRLRGSDSLCIEDKVEPGSVVKNTDDPEPIQPRRSGLFARRINNMADFDDED